MNKNLRQALEKLRIEYVEKLSETTQQIDELYQRLKGSTEIEVMETLMQICHKLAGSGGTFGLPVLSDAAKNLELVLSNILEKPNEKLLESQYQIILKNSEMLLQECRNIISYSNPKIGKQEYLIKAEKELSNLILIKSDENQHINQLSTQLCHIGFDVSIIKTFMDLSRLAEEKLPSLIIIKTEFSDSELSEIQDFLGQRSRKTENIPLLYLCERNNFTARLTAVRLEGAGFLGLPTNSIKVIDQYYYLTQKQHARNYHVLIIDDDPILAKRYALALENVGIQVTILTNPNQALNLLSEKTVDLVLLDFHLQECNGFEVAKILRQLDHYISLPIIFLSTEINLNRFMRSAHLGIDDFLTKPIVDEDLISIVMRRAERSYILRNLIEQDSATGLLNHSRLKLDLHLEVLRSDRTGMKFRYALIDIDHFKVVNDTYGHFTGDIVIKTLAHLLQQRLRSIDRIGRYGGEEFGIIFPNTSVEEGLSVLAQIHKKFSEIEFMAGESKFFVTFSAGIAEYPTFMTGELLNLAADAALYESKRGGRNRLTIATPEVVVCGMHHEKSK